MGMPGMMPGMMMPGMGMPGMMPGMGMGMPGMAGPGAAATPAAATAAGAAATPAAAAAPAAAPAVVSRFLLLENLVPPEEVDDTLEAEVKEECELHGPVVSVKVATLQAGEDVKLYVEFKEPQHAAAAAAKLHRRYFDGRIVSATVIRQEDLP